MDVLQSKNHALLNKQIIEKVHQAVRKGLAFLSKRQNKDGSWSEKVGYKLNFSVIGDKAENVGVTAIAGMAFLAGGSTPRSGPYTAVVRKAVQFVIQSQNPQNGYISQHGTRMYEHAFATLFLAEVYGEAPTLDVRKSLSKAVELIVKSQNKLGGWRYQPSSQDADISVTVSTLQALRAARNVGIAVPKTTIQKALLYVQKSQFFRPGDPDDGGFNYQLLFESRHDSFALTACGLTALLSLGTYQGKAITDGLAFLWRHFLDNTQSYSYQFYYGHYYGSQVMYMAGPRNWELYYQRVVALILPNQNEDGSWMDEVGPVYATAMACIILQMQNEYLPIFQR